MRLSYFAAFGVPLAAMLALGGLSPADLDGVRNFSFDTYQRLRPRVWSPDSPVRIIDIDDESLARLGQWPWPRNRLADMVRIASDSNAATIAFDTAFSEPDRLSPEFFTRELDEKTRDAVGAALANVESYDDQFARAIAKGNVVLGAIMTNRGRPLKDFPVKAGFAYAGDDPTPWLPDFPSAAQPLPKLAADAAGVGLLNWVPGRDQVVREAPLLMRSGPTLIPSLALEALRTAQGASTVVIRSSNASGQTAFGAQTGVNAVKVGDYVMATGPNAERRIYFSHTERGRFIPAWKLLAGEVSRDELDGRILLVGASAAGVLDQRATPLDRLVPGVEVHAQLIEHVLAGGDLARPDWAPPAELVAALALALAACFAASIATPFVGAIIGLAAIGAITGVGWIAFSRYGVLLDPLYPSATVAVAYLAGVVELFRFERAQKAQVKNAFGRFVSPAIVERLAASPDRLTLGGESREITLMFCDLRDFTGLSEGLEAQEIIAFMNDYLTPLSDLILASSGTIDKFIGDAIMAFWNAPLDEPQHARQACSTALAMRQALVAFNASRVEIDHERGRVHREAHFGVGLNTGVCSVGNLGSVRRFDYSAIGDPVNVASRIESLTKFYACDLMASEQTQEAAPEFAWLEVESVRVKGRATPTRLFALVGDAVRAESQEFVELRARHQFMLSAYVAGEFDTAIAIAGKNAAAHPDLAAFYARYAELCGEASRVPAEKWNPVRSMLEK